MEIKLLLELLGGKETHSKRRFFYYYYFKHSNEWPNQLEASLFCEAFPRIPLCSGSFALQKAEPCCKHGLSPPQGCHLAALLSLPGHGVQRVQQLTQEKRLPGNPPSAEERVLGNLVSLLGELRRERVLIALMRLLLKKQTNAFMGRAETSVSPERFLLSPCITQWAHAVFECCCV